MPTTIIRANDPPRCWNCEEEIGGLVFYDWAGDPECYDCHDHDQEMISRDPEDCALIHDYDYKPTFQYHRGKDEPEKPLYFGIELEVEKEGSGDIERDIRSMPDFTYCKEDGSIEYGFEVVTHPISYQWILENKRRFDPIFRLGKEGRYTSHSNNTCGMHVHLSKRCFGTYHLYRFLKFFYDMDTRFIVAISQRGDSDNMEEYCRTHKERSSMSLAREKQGGDRFTAVNLQNKHTIEVRIFKGTLKKEAFFKNIEFLQSVYLFTKEHKSKQITTKEYLKYVKKNYKKYKNLYSFLKSRHFYKGVK